MKTKESITLRHATINDINLLKRWDKEEHIILSNPHSQWDWEKELKNTPEYTTHFIAEVNNKPIGFVEVIDPAKEKTHYWGKVEENMRAMDIWIGEKEYIGRGYGTKIMQKVTAFCFSDKKVKGILVDPLESNVKAHNFYKKCGFTFVEKKMFGNDSCFVFKLDKKTWEQSS